MTEQIATHHSAAAPVDIDAKIRHLSRRIPRLEDMLTWGGYAKPYTPENPAVIAERTNRQLALIADLRAQLAHWEAQAASAAATARSN
ncbi:hypothetical protein C3B59_05950 [Cryobacterium zongtaii]|uniref:Uncharacterized protein n=1 Tax=Cryobacterium zongtaii TaxID=1259217 RepID=A0A2S3ZLG8_9MICO|nr:hypothetical protein [Cryobacterium zongtaii]POH69179.1 hypothetical protein C3B59_05950 [Cryobacterium zongtaii]